MKSEDEYYELEKRYLKLKDKFDDFYSEHIKIVTSLNGKYEDALNQRNKSSNRYYEAKREYDILRYDYTELEINSKNSKWILPKLDTSEIEKYLRNKKLDRINDEKK